MGSTAGRPIVLVPGACLGGWSWREVTARLRQHGHDAYPVTLTGLGDRVHLARPEVDLETHIADVVNLLEYEDLEHALLVGHSYAGTVVRAVADRVPGRLEAVVYLDTSPLPDGTAIADLQQQEQRESQTRLVAERGDGWRWPVPDRETLLAGTFGSASGLGEEHLRLIDERATAHPYATMTSRVRLAHGWPSDVRRAAIFCTEGGVDVTSVRELIAEGDPRAAAFAEDDWELYDLATGHWAMLSLPGPLADLLHGIAER